MTTTFKPMEGRRIEATKRSRSGRIITLEYGKHTIAIVDKWFGQMRRGSRKIWHNTIIAKSKIESESWILKRWETS